MGNLCSQPVAEEKPSVAASQPVSKPAEPPPAPPPAVQQTVGAPTPRSSATLPDILNPAAQSVAEPAVKDMDVQLDLSSRPASTTAILAGSRPP